MSSGPPAAPEPPPVAARVFGDRLPLARRYADRLATAGLVRGLLGPREVPRLWNRHLLNCAVLADLLPEGARVVDIGSGAGLPGVALACRRADLRVDLVEPMRRRVTFLVETVELLGLGDQLRVVTGRADDASVRDAAGGACWVTARAVAPLARLVEWCIPLLRPDGTLLAMKGARAGDEVTEARSVLRGRGVSADLVRCGEDVLDRPVTVVRVRRRGRETGKADGGGGSRDERCFT